MTGVVCGRRWKVFVRGEDGEEWAGVMVIWSRAEMLWVWASLLSWWAEADEGREGASTLKVMLWSMCMKVMVKP